MNNGRVLGMSRREAWWLTHIAIMFAGSVCLTHFCRMSPQEREAVRLRKAKIER